MRANKESTCRVLTGARRIYKLFISVSQRYSFYGQVNAKPLHIWGLGMTNFSLSLTHHRLYQPKASEQFGANQLSAASDLSWSLAQCEVLCPQASAGVWHYRVLSAGPVDPSGTPTRSGSHLYRSLLNVNMSLLERGRGKRERQLSRQ